MKKVLSFIFTMGILLGAISCQESEFSNFGEGFKIKASIEPMGTRVDFSVNSDSKTITPAFAVGDKVIGCDDLGQTFTFSVKSLNGKYAELDANGYVPGDAKRVWAFYCPGRTVDDIQIAKTDTSFNMSLEVDLTSQDGKLGADSPAIMGATADIKGIGGLSLGFNHLTAIISVNAMKVNPGEKIKSVAITGAKTAAKFVVKAADGSIETSTNTARKPVNVTTDLTADADGVINTPVYVAVIPTDMVNLSVVATNDKGEKMSNIYSATKCDIEAGKYYYTSRILGNVAMIVETGKLYGTIEEAFRDAETATQPTTVKLLADCTIIEDMPAINNSYGITLDLNGKTLTATASVLDTDETLMYKRIWIETGSVTIKDGVGGGRLVHAAGNNCNVVMHGAGTLTVESGSIESLYPKGNDGSVAILVNDGKLILNGGTIKGNSATDGSVTVKGSSEFIPMLEIPATSTVEIESINKYALDLEMADAEIAGGTVTTGASYALNATDNCYVNISGGKFTATDPELTDAAIAARFYNGPQAEITGGEFTGTARAFSCNAETNYSGDVGKVSIKGGKFSSVCGYTIYGGRFVDILVEGGSFYSEKHSNVFKGYTSGSLIIADGYFYTNAASEDSLLCINGNYAKAYGGYFNTTTKDVNITNAKVCKKLDTPVEYEGRLYGYTFGENDSYVAEVNGTQYKDMIQAANAAIDYVGSGDAVIKIIQDCKLDATVNLTNKLFKDVTLDLNGHTLTATVDSCITTTGTLTITDNSGTPGKIVSSHRKPVSLLTEGTINIKRITIECSATGANTNHVWSVICILGEANNANATINISDGAKVISTQRFKAIHIRQGKLNLENCEISTGTESSGFYGVYGYTGAQITINDGTSINVAGARDSAGTALYIAGKTAATKFTVNGGYFSGGIQDGYSINGDKDKSHPYAYYSLTVNGGYFRQDISATECHYGDGKSLKPCEVKHTHNGKELTYHYKVE